MYSLYRAWFGSPEDSYPRLEGLGLSPPDTLVRVGNEGEYHFVAHRSVLAAHSGYLKALLAAAVAVNAASNSSSSSPPPSSSSGGNGDSNNNNNAASQQQPLVTSITVPSTIGGEAFAPLLNYMYTGRLEVTLDNIYSVLLATHLLHMPGALEQCRAALLRLRGPVVPPSPVSPPPPPPPVVAPTTSSSSSPPITNNHNHNHGSILRPVPNRLWWPQHRSPLYDRPALPPHLQLTPAACLTALPAGPILRGTEERSSPSPTSSSSLLVAQPPQRGCSRSPLTSPELVVASSASNSRGPSPCSPNSSERISIGEESPLLQHQTTTVPLPLPETTTTTTNTGSTSITIQRQQTTSSAVSRRRRAPQKRHAGSTSSSSSTATGMSQQQQQQTTTPGVVYDVACCDGPVRFHRVLNENYAPASVAQTTTRVAPHRVPIGQMCNGRVSVASVSADEPLGRDENDENEEAMPRGADDRIATALNDSGSGAEGRSGGSYTCGYCQHTFKSQYCYRKHARRHLLPTDASASAATTDSENAESRRRAQQQQQHHAQAERAVVALPQSPTESVGKKREVRLLDLNVQYYPCKICGSKFPSYYFVHKHRKLCHANVEDPPQQQQQQQSRDSVSSATDDRQPRTKDKAQTQTQSQTTQPQPSTSEGVQQPA